MKVAVLMLTMSKPEIFRKVLTELLASDITEGNEVKVFCHENCSTGYARKVLTELGGNFYVSESIGNEFTTLPSIRLMGEILKGDFDVFVEIHDDMIFIKKWFNDLVRLFKVNEKYHILMPMPVPIESMEETPEDIERKIREGKKVTVAEYRDRPIPGPNTLIEYHVQVLPWVVDIPFLRQFGYYDPKFSPIGAEDDDFYFSSIKNGAIPVVYGGSRVGHRYLGTRGSLSGAAYCDYFQIFYAKHGIGLLEFKEKYLTFHEVKLG